MLKFEYIALNVGTTALQLVHLPALEITLESNGDKFSAICLIDSGAEFCVFDASIGEAMGLVIEEGIQVELGGVQDPKYKAFLHDIVYELGGKKYSATVAFVRNIRMGYQILGRNGFLDHFKLSIDHKNKKFSLDPY